MNVLLLQVFVSLVLVAGAVVLFAYSVKQADHEHADRLSLFPLEDDGPSADGELEKNHMSRPPERSQEPAEES